MDSSGSVSSLPEATTRRLRVGVLYPFWHGFPPPEVDSAMQVVGLDLSRHLAAIGVDVRLYSEGRGPRWSTVEADGVVYRGVPRLLDVLAERVLRAKSAISRRRHRTSETRPENISILYKLSYSALAAWDMRRWKCDIAHVSIFDQLIPVIRAISPKTRIVFHLHDHKQIYRDPKLTERRLAKADAIVGCSEFVTKRVQQRFPRLADRCITILNAVDADFYDHATPNPTDPPHPDRILFIGRISPEKGVHILLKAFELVHATHPDAQLTLAGRRRSPPHAKSTP